MIFFPWSASSLSPGKSEEKGSHRSGPDHERWKTDLACRAVFTSLRTGRQGLTSLLLCS